jgi:CBS domain containing-hemolysin-like protein
VKVWTPLVIGIAGILLGGAVTTARSVLLALGRDEIEALRSRHRGLAARALGWMDQPERFVQGAQWAQEALFIGCTGGILYPFLKRGQWVEGLLAGMAFLWMLMWMGEGVAHAVAVRNPRRWAPLMIWVFAWLGWMAIPWRVFVGWIRRLGLGRSEGRPDHHAPLLTRQELSWILRGREDNGALLKEEKKLITRIFRFSETQVREVMIPLVEVSAVEETAPVEEVIRRVDREGFSRFPVYRERIDRMYGVVHGFDFLTVESLEEPLSPYIRKALFVPESMPADDLLLELQRSGNHMAIVVNEYGGGVGIVTLEDVLEEIVGEIQDEHDSHRVLYKRLSPQHFLISARMEIDELNEIFGLRIPKGDYETLGGFLLSQFQRIPKEGEAVVFRGLRFTVRRADERRIHEVLVTLPRLDVSSPKGARKSG